MSTTSVIAGKIYDYDWVTQRATTSYPLVHDVPGLNNSFILDAKILVPITTQQLSNQYSIASTTFRISKIINAPDGYIIQLSDQNNIIGRTGPISKKLQLLDQLNQDYISDIRERTYFVSITDDKYKDLQISLYIGDTINYTGGTIILDKKDQGLLSSFCRTVYSPIAGGVTSLNKLTGDITIQASQGISIKIDTQNNKIIIQRQLYKFQNDLSQILKNYIKTINGVKPDADGNIKLLGSDCLSVKQTTDNTLVVQNPCGKPCCSLQQYSTQLTKTVQLLVYQKQTIRQMIQSMGNNINFMQANLSSILGK